MRRFCFVAPVLCCAVSFFALSTLPARAQAAQTTPAKPPGLLDTLPYDAAKRGPLLLIEASDVWAVYTSAKGKTSLSALTEALGRRVVVVGGLTVIVPSTMRVLEEHPGKPNPFAGLKAHECLKVLLALLNPAQWELAGSGQGIGAGDLNDQQKALFAELLPEQLVIQRARFVPGDKPNEYRAEYQGDKQEFNPNMARLRLIRQTTFQFAREGAKDYGYRATARPADAGEEHTMSPIGGGARADKPPDDSGKTDVFALGVPIIRAVPNALKRSQLNFKSAKMRAQVALNEKEEPLEDLLQRVAQATGMELLCDKRLADLRVVTRIAPNQSARAGEILQALCWSVTGAFRQVGASTFLLTDDIQGIGTRFEHLDEWAEEAGIARYKAMQELEGATAKNDPLSHIKFAPGDPFALPPDLLKRADDAYRASRETEINPADLPEPLRRSLDFHLEGFSADGTKFRMDRVRVGTQLSAQYVLPNGAALEVPFAQNIGSHYLQNLATLPAHAVAAPLSTPVPAPPMPMPATLKKRVLLADLPPDAKSIAALLVAAKSKGFTETWLRVLLNDAAAPERLKIAVTAGKDVGLRIGVAVSLLRNNGLAGQEDVNVFGETGAQLAARRGAGKPDVQADLVKMAGWQVWDEKQVMPLLSRLSQVPGLCAFALKATAAPGCAGDPGGGDGIWRDGHLGYDVETRLACIRKEGFDPIDAAAYSNNLSLTPTLPFFEDRGNDLWKPLTDFRLTRNKQALAQIYATLHQSAPGLPLYLDDRASSYTDPNLSWHGKWDAPERIPINPMYWGDSEGREKAFAGSSEPLLNLRGTYGNPQALAYAVGRVAQRAAQDWRGLTFDLTELTIPQTLRMLEGLPASR